MSKIKLQGNASGTGILTIESPNTDTDRTLTLPDGAGEILTNATGLTSSSSLNAANLTGTLPAIDGSSLTGISAVWNVVSSGTASAATYLEIAIPSTYETYALKLVNLVPSVDAALFAQVSTDNGSTYLSGASDYSFTNTNETVADLTLKYQQASASTFSNTSLDGFVYISGTQNTSAPVNFMPYLYYPYIPWAPAYGNIDVVRSSRANTTSVVNKIRVGYDSSATFNGSYVLYGISES